MIEPQKVGAMKRTSKRQAITTALVWELCWLPVEMACVGFGLWLSLKLQWMTVGSLWLLAFLAVDFMLDTNTIRRLRQQSTARSLNSSCEEPTDANVVSTNAVDERTLR